MAATNPVDPAFMYDTLSTGHVEGPPARQIATVPTSGSLPLDRRFRKLFLTHSSVLPVEDSFSILQQPLDEPVLLFVGYSPHLATLLSSNVCNEDYTDPGEEYVIDLSPEYPPRSCNYDLEV